MEYNTHHPGNSTQEYSDYFDLDSLTCNSDIFIVSEEFKDYQQDPSLRLVLDKLVLKSPEFYQEKIGLSP